MIELKPWITGPYELLRRAALHLTDGGDFDRRMALITYDRQADASPVFGRDLTPVWITTRSHFCTKTPGMRIVATSDPEYPRHQQRSFL